MSQENVESIRGIYEAFGKGDVPAVLGQMDQGIEWREAENFIYADRNPYVGPQAVLEGVFMRLGSEWDDFTVTPEEWLDAGNHVVVLGTTNRFQVASQLLARGWQLYDQWAAEGRPVKARREK